MVKVMTAYLLRRSGLRDASRRLRGALAALELTAHSRWWNRWKHRLMARALVACAEEMECAADEGRLL